jgi:hypothetical protein
MSHEAVGHLGRYARGVNGIIRTLNPARGPRAEHDQLRRAIRPSVGGGRPCRQAGAQSSSGVPTPLQCRAVQSVRESILWKPMFSENLETRTETVGYRTCVRDLRPTCTTHYANKRSSAYYMFAQNPFSYCFFINEDLRSLLSSKIDTIITSSVK